MKAPFGFILVGDSQKRIAVKHIVAYVRIGEATKLWTSDCRGEEVLTLTQTPEDIDTLIREAFADV